MDISHHIWDTRYRYRRGAMAYDRSLEDMWRRIADATAAAEPSQKADWAERFYRALSGFRFIPGGRIQAGAGTAHKVTLFNCFVMGLIEDSLDGIFEALHEGAVTMQQGGGIGYDFSTLRPRGTRTRGAGTIASGPVSFMRVFDAMCATILSTGARRGAMMATLRCDHPDIAEFIAAKRVSGHLSHFNLSVQVTDAFMDAVRADQDWALVFPAAAIPAQQETIIREWPGYDQPVACGVTARIRARDLWQSLLRAAYDCSEPGVLFIDRINRMNNLSYCERITATNPCGEVPLPPYGACVLGSLNLTQFISDPFSPKARLEHRDLQSTAQIAVRLLDNVIDISRYPLERQRQAAQHSRRIGLGITGLADTLVMLGLHYGGEEAPVLADTIMRSVCEAAYRASVTLATEKGSFPAFQVPPYLAGAFIQALPEEIRGNIESTGIRNSHLLAIAPAGTISLLAGNISSGIEPIYAADYRRTVAEETGTSREFRLTSYSVRHWRETTGQVGLPPAFVTAADLPINAHIGMQAVLQRHVDNSISKTIHVPPDTSFESFREVYDRAFDTGLKGCTVYRPNPTRGAVLKPAR